MDWKSKLTSRKFWAAIAGFVTGLIVFIKNPTSDAQAVTALIMAFGSLVAYIIGEGMVDKAGAGNDTPLVVQAQIPTKDNLEALDDLLEDLKNGNDTDVGEV